jgi:uncharacterized repeat protein (TIGR03803 family)
VKNNILAAARGINFAAVAIATSLCAVAPAVAAAQFTVIHRFGDNPDGNHPQSQLTFGDNPSVIYGTTYNGGAHSVGTIFSLTRIHGTTTWRKRTLYSFPVFGGNPFAGVVKWGNFLYGTTTDSPQGNGTAFRFNPDSRTLQTIYNFDTDPDRNGNDPQARLHVWNGKLYGANAVGGPGSGGTIFQLSKAQDPAAPWDIEVLLRFNGNNGFNTAPGFIINRQGDIFGNTYAGGTTPSGSGVVYQLKHLGDRDSGRWDASLLSQFRGGQDGTEPYGQMVEDRPGVLFGVTNRGGLNSVGTIFRMTLKDGEWTRQTLLHFPYVTDGPEYSSSGLVRDSRGALYGSSNYGGRYDAGTLYQVLPPALGNGQWRLRVLHHFGGADGRIPAAAPLVQETDNRIILYGTTTAGGKDENGVVYRMTIDK